MPSGDTFSIPPITAFVQRYFAVSRCSVDPFARNNEGFTYTNDLDPATKARSHQDAAQFLRALALENVRCDLGIFDPPYSPRQISELYKTIGASCGTRETQNGRLYKEARDALDECMAVNGVVLSFGWNSCGMGKGRGYHLLEILLVAHGGAHNDTICVAEVKL